MEVGVVVRVIRDFLTTNDGELCVSSGEYLQVVQNVDRYWVECKLDLRQGLLPSANVTPVEIPPLQDGQKNLHRPLRVLCSTSRRYVSEKRRSSSYYW